MKEFSHFSLKDFNTFGLDVYASRFIEYNSAEDVIAICKTLQTPYIIIGRGSNLLFTSDFKGTVLHCSNQDIVPSSIQADPSTVLLEVGAGTIWDNLVEWSIKHGLSGIENLSLIPGEVGSAAVQNIGAYGVEAKDFIEWVEFVRIDTGEICQEDASHLHYSYRQSIFKNEWADKCAITRVGIRLSKQFLPRLEYGTLQNRFRSTEPLTPQIVRNGIIEIRRQKLPDPKVIGNAGSFFMNPIVSKDIFDKIHSQYPEMPYYEQNEGVKIPAGWLIEQSGWKGKSLGHAGVYEKQALVLVNLGNATGEDISILSDTIRKEVFNKFGIHLHPEVRFI